jgi:osmotically-inducible protein OsmY
MSRMQRFFVSTILILAGALSNGCRTSSQPVDDAAIKAAVKAKLATQFELTEARQERQEKRGADKETISDIIVDSGNGVVTLTGEVRSERAKTEAGKLARGVKQVVSVNNNLAVAPPYSDDAVGK